MVAPRLRCINPRAVTATAVMLPTAAASMAMLPKAGGGPLAGTRNRLVLSGAERETDLARILGDQPIHRFFQVDADGLLSLARAQHRGVLARREFREPQCGVRRALGQLDPVLDSPDGARERCAAGPEHLARHDPEPFGQVPANALRHLGGVPRPEQLEIEIFGMTLGPHGTGRPEADLP